MHFKNFDINLFVVFDQLWRTRSVSAAADALCVSQPTVSSSLKKLRDYFSDKLFVWVGGEMKPTPKAEILIVEIREVLEKTGMILDQTELDPLLAKRSISVSTADYVIGALGPHIGNCIDAEAPRLRVDFMPFEAQMVLSKGSRAADMFICPNSSVTATQHSHRIIHRDRYVIMACKANKRIKKSLSADQFLEAPKVAFSATPNGVENHEFSWFPQSSDLNLKALLPNYLLIPLFVHNTDNIAVVPLTLMKLFLSLGPVGQKIPPSQMFAPPFKILEPPVDIPPIEAGLYWDPVYEHDALHSWVRTKIEEAAAISDEQNEEILSFIQ